jgi:chromosomal replication initiation ATPase DnaA
LLSLFAKNQKQAKKRYRSFVESVQDEKIENPSADIEGGFILGGVDFVNWVKDSFLNKGLADKEIPQLRSLKPKLTPKDLLPVVCEEFDCERDVIIQKGKKRNLVRDVAIYLSREMTGESGVSLGRYFGGISGSGVTLRYNYIADKIKRDRNLRGQINNIRKKIIKS